MPLASAPYRALAAALRERRAIIADREFYASDPAAHLKQLSTVSERIVQLGNELPDPDPKLVHYLERCSYDKALAFIEDF